MTSFKFSRAVLSTHLYLLREELSSRDYDRLCSDLRFTSRYGETEDAIPVYDNSRPNWFGVPLYHYTDPASVADHLEDIRSDGQFVRWKFTSEYRTGQPEVIHEFRKWREEGATGFIFEAPPAFGKTVCLLKKLEIIGRTALVVVPRSNLIKQWRERITEHTNLTEDDIGWAEGGRAVWEGKPICVGLVHTLALDRFGADFKRFFGAVVFDEVDRSVPPQTFAPVVGMFPSRYRIGASATTKRKDGLHVILEKHIGQCTIRGTPKQRMLPKILRVNFNGSSGKVYKGSARLNRRGMILSRLANNGDRNALLARYIWLIYNSGRRCLVLSDRTLQLKVLRSLLILDGMDPEEIGYYARKIAIPRKSPKEKQKYEGVNDAERERAASACKIVLATYGMFAIGSDVLDLSGLVYGTPQSETEQSQGRIERPMEGKKEPVVVDVVDTYYKDSVIWAQNRLRTYRKMGLEVKTIK
jgi:superfamily II DNA or RNA helicase